MHITRNHRREFDGICDGKNSARQSSGKFTVTRICDLTVKISHESVYKIGLFGFCSQRFRLTVRVILHGIARWNAPVTDLSSPHAFSHGYRMRPHTFQTSQLELTYLAWGPASGCPVVLLHGFPDDALAYTVVGERLGAEGLSCARFLTNMRLKTPPNSIRSRVRRGAPAVHGTDRTAPDR